ncbi:hypothetical protein BgiMline_005483, partial [Biomphalaria glabrata]
MCTNITRAHWTLGIISSFPQCCKLNVWVCTLFVFMFSACLKNDVTRLVYTSTYNVVYGGQEIHNGDESCPYLSEDK